MFEEWYYIDNEAGPAQPANPTGNFAIKDGPNAVFVDGHLGREQMVSDRSTKAPAGRDDWLAAGGDSEAGKLKSMDSIALPADGGLE